MYGGNPVHITYLVTTTDLLIEWGASLYDYWEPATVKQAVTAARGWLQWCYQKQLINDKAVPEALETPKVKKRIQRTLWPNEIEGLLKACDLKTVKGLRDAALILLLVDSGLRSAEIRRLKVEDVDLKAKVLKVIIKGGDEARGYFGDETRALLYSWPEIRPAKPGV